MKENCQKIGNNSLQQKLFFKNLRKGRDEKNLVFEQGRVYGNLQQFNVVCVSCVSGNYLRTRKFQKTYFVEKLPALFSEPANSTRNV